LWAFDASSIIHAWDNYPRENFPALWQWIGAQISQGRFVMPKVAFEEVDHQAPDCAQWLRKQSIERTEMTNEIVQEAERIKELLEISGDSYHAKGVNENDLFIIATASVLEYELITNEARQITAPEIPAKRRIPAVCGMPSVDVPCIDFIALIKQSKEVFGR
jgi:predicted nucleic acid-binding protein